MKKTAKIIGLLLFMMTESVFGSTMCVKDDVFSIVLDPGIGSSTTATYSGSGVTTEWTTTFSYGQIRGIAACLSSNYSQSMGGYVAQLSDTNPTTGETARVVGGETNGLHCWCKMTHPAVSLWVFHYSYSSADGCAWACANDCGNNVRYYSSMRGGLFGSVRQ